MSGLISGFSILFHWSLCLFLCQYRTVLITILLTISNLLNLACFIFMVYAFETKHNPLYNFSYAPQVLLPVINTSKYNWTQNFFQKIIYKFKKMLFNSAWIFWENLKLILWPDIMSVSVCFSSVLVTSLIVGSGVPSILEMCFFFFT